MIDGPESEDATESAPPYSYAIDAYMKEGRTCEGVVRALEQTLDREFHELPPLYTVVDPDALNQLFRPRRDDRLRPDVSLTFTYLGYRVTVSADGRLTIQT